METTQLQWHQIIRELVLDRPDAIVATSVRLWQRLAEELVSIIGEGGFQSLYSRSLHLLLARFAWLPVPPASVSMLATPQPESRFVALAQCLSSRTHQDAAEGSIALFCTFIDTLALLIGEHMTTRILRSAWGDAALDLAVKEPPQ